jgi:hypothetical protein
MVFQPLVSIIIPTYNDGPLLFEAIDSALIQTYQQREIIVIDDGSIDDTGLLLKKQYRNKIIYHRQENKGPSSARNMGLRLSSGRYVQFLDADDLLHPDKISLQIRQLQSISGLALSYCDYVRCNIDDSKVIPSRTSPILQSENPLEDIMLKWETEVSVPIHCFLFDSALFKKFKIMFDESLPANEDWVCWMNVFSLRPQVVFVDQVLAYYRVRESSRCRDRTIMRRAWISAIKKQINKNYFNNELIAKLNFRMKEIRYAYRDVSPLMKIMQRHHPSIKKFYEKITPWRLQRIFD